MDQPFFLTLQQVDTINGSLDKAMAVAQMVAECGGERHSVPTNPSPPSLFMVMQVIVDELEKIEEVMKERGRGKEPHPPVE
ncbi:MAG: hypothetical protein HQM02_10440 [Magnetococcales bacterium]|nr:hypothetical protein [Magnetococcales bacterium]